MNFWVVKGRPAENKFDEMLIPRKEQAWRTLRPFPKQMVQGDRVFIWASSPHLELVGIAEFVSLRAEKDAEGNNRFILRYLTQRLPAPLGLEYLRADSDLNAEGVPSFLKAGAAGTIFFLTRLQGQRLNSLVLRHNPALVLSTTDSDLNPSDLADPPDRIATTISRIIRDTVKSKSLKALYAHRCQVCNLEIQVTPGVYYAEVHHIRPLGTPHDGTDEHPNMIVLCPTHHAMFDLAVPRFVTDSSVELYGTVHSLTTRHALSGSSIDYHNQLFDARELKVVAVRGAP